MLCQCGCGEPTEIANETRPRRGWVKGQPKPYLPHHKKRQRVSRDGQTKTCNYCKETKPLTEFNRMAESPDGHQVNCRACGSKKMKAYAQTEEGREAIDRSRQRWRIARYGISVEDYDRLHAEQGGVCAICKTPERAIRNGKPKALAIDHCHREGHVRALLCSSCNQGIGCFQDDPALLERAAAYLKK